MKLVKLLLRLFQFLLIIFITLLAFYLLNNNFSFVPKYQTFVVQSGSMEPAIMTGDIIVVQTQEKYFINDVITFLSGENKRVVTHRIIEINSDNNFITKGDANRVGDDDVVSFSDVVGKVILVVPRLGFLVAFTQTTPGLVVMVLIPVIILVLDKLLKIINVSKKS